MNEQLLCLDCQHRFVPWYNWLNLPINSKHRYLCRKSYQSAQVKYNPVTGAEPQPESYQTCSVFRVGASKEGNCGEDAYYWAPRTKQGLFKLIQKESK